VKDKIRQRTLEAYKLETNLMKKIIALAVAAVAAAPAMADLTISGTAAVGYSASNAAYWTDYDLQQLANCQAGANNATEYADCSTAAQLPAKSGKGDAGFGVDTATLSIAGSETLENGMTVSGFFGFGGGGRGMTTGGQDAGLSVAGDFGTVTLKAAEIGDGIYAYGSSVAENMQGELTAPAGNSDSFSYVAPAMGMVTLSTGFTETLDLGKGQDGDYALNLKAAVKASDMVSGFVDWRPEQGDTNGRVRVGAKLATGMFTVSAAHEVNDDANDSTSTNIGADVMIGATTVGLNYGIEDAGTGANAKDTGVSFGFKHAITDNLALTGKYTQYEDGAVDVTKSSVLMSLAF